MSALTADNPAAGRTEDPYRVLVVDDSAVIRTMLSQWLDSDPQISVVGVASDGQMAVDAVRRLRPEVVLLDIEMPRLTGLEALPQIVQASPDVKVIMVSTLTHAGAEISLKALSIGAADYVAKPQTGRDGAAESFRRDLFSKVKALGGATRRALRRRAAPMPLGPKSDRPATPGFPAAAKSDRTTFALRPPTGIPPRILLIGSSTGGPQALIKIFENWKTPPRIPVIITQHMPPTFTTILAQRLDSLHGIHCREAQDGDEIQPGNMYLAPGDYHLLIEGGRVPTIRLNQGPQENYCRPAVDPMFRSAAKVYGSGTLGVVLTGMGHDGLEGARQITDVRGTIIAQDQGSSVVWGMPGAVATAGLCTRVVPLDDMSSTLREYLSGETP